MAYGSEIMPTSVCLCSRLCRLSSSVMTWKVKDRYVEDSADKYSDERLDGWMCILLSRMSIKFEVIHIVTHAKVYNKMTYDFIL